MPRPFHTSVDGIAIVGRFRQREKRGYYYVRFTVNSKRYELSTKQSARSAALAVTEDLVRSITRTPKTNLSTAELLDRYLQTAYADGRMAHYTARREGYRARLVMAHVPYITAADLTLQDANALRIALLETHSPKSTNNALSLLKSAYRWGHDTGLLPTNPLAALRLVPNRRVASTKRFVRTYTEAEFRAILEAAQGMGQYYHPILTIAYTGMRRGELIRLRVADVETNGDRLFFRIEQGKSAQARTIPVHSRIAPVIRHQTQSQPPHAILFPGRSNRPLDPQSLTRACRRAVESAGITDIRKPLHTFRHTFATNLLRAGIPDRIVMKIMGHRDAKTLSIYAHITDRDSEGSVEAVTW